MTDPLSELYNVFEDIRWDAMPGTGGRFGLSPEYALGLSGEIFYRKADMTNPKVSVILPVKNASKTLDTAIRSILLQDSADWEMLVMLDGSDENTRRIAKSFAIYNRLRIFDDNVTKGISFRLNQGISQSGGTYIARMDSDDISFPNRLSAQLRYLEEHPKIDLVGSSALYFDSTGQVLGKSGVLEDHEQICSDPFAGIRIAHPTWMGKRAWFLSSKYDPNFDGAEDQDLLLRVYERSHYGNVPEVLLGYREVTSFSKSLKRRRTQLKSQICFLIRNRKLGLLLIPILKVGTRAVMDCAYFLVKSEILRRKLQPVDTDLQAQWKKLVILLEGDRPSASV